MACTCKTDGYNGKAYGSTLGEVTDDEAFQALYDLAVRIFPNEVEKAQAWALARLQNLAIQRAGQYASDFLEKPWVPFVLGGALAYLLLKK